MQKVHTFCPFNSQQTQTLGSWRPWFDTTLICASAFPIRVPKFMAADSCTKWKTLSVSGKFLPPAMSASACFRHFANVCRLCLSFAGKLISPPRSLHSVSQSDREREGEENEERLVATLSLDGRRRRMTFRTRGEWGSVRRGERGDEFMQGAQLNLEGKLFWHKMLKYQGIATLGLKLSDASTLEEGFWVSCSHAKIWRQQYCLGQAVKWLHSSWEQSKSLLYFRTESSWATL